MTPLKHWFMLLLLFSALSAQSQELSQYQWSNRLLLIMSDDPNSPEINRQMSLFANESKALNERKLLILRVLPHFYLMGTDNFVRRQTSEIYFDYKTAQRPFEVVLIGLDGSEKLRKSELVFPSDIYTIIDSMPMRRAEKN